METAAETSQEKPVAQAPERPVTAPAPLENGKPVWVEPDLDFIRTLIRHGGDSLKKCMQCGTCSATCTLSPDREPFPRKEMIWAAWGMKDRLLRDPDVWLCHQCNDCSTRCPRTARPGEILGIIRGECVRHYTTPRFLARWVSQPQCIPLLLGIPAALLTLALVLREPIEDTLGISRQAGDGGDGIVYSYSSMFPHWLLNSFFGLFSLLALLAILAGVVRFWRAMKASLPSASAAAPVKKLGPSIGAALKSIFTHEDFASCEQARSRRFSHLSVFFGFLALSLVTIWVITARYNPLIQGDFIYPFGFWNPWKILANIGGLAVTGGCLWMMWDRLRENERTGAGTYFDWALLSAILLVAITGFVTELLHYLRLEPHRHIAYFAHLVLVFAVLIYLPYSKLAHLFYRGAAMVFAEQFGRRGSGQASKEEGKSDAGDTTAGQ